MFKGYRIIMTKRKKYILALAAFVATNPIQQCYAEKLFQSGAYAGATFGFSLMNSSIKDSLFIPVVINKNAQSRTSHTHLVTDLFTGYRFFMNNGLFTGLELSISLDKNKNCKTFALTKTLKSDTKLSSRYKIIPTLALGKRLSPKWLGFTKVGLSVARFKSQHIMRSATAMEQERFSTIAHGVKGSVGLEYAHSNKVSTIGSLSYEHFKNIKRTYKNISPWQGEKGRGSIKPRYITAQIGILYHF